MIQIQKRDKSLTNFIPSKIHNRIKKAAKNLKVNSDEIFIKVITSIPTDGKTIITTKELDRLITEICASYTGTNQDYSIMAANVDISSYHKETKDNFYEKMKEYSEDKILADGEIFKAPISKKLIEIIEDYGVEKVNSLIDYQDDYTFDYFGWKSMCRTYLLKNEKGEIVERPQETYLRVALWITDNFEDAKEYYNSLKKQLISNATPITINSGTKNPQLASCVLHFNDGDSREGLLKTITEVSSWSADAAGIGLCLSNQRSKDSKISSSGGNAGGVLKFVKIINESLRFFNQQGKRPGSAAVYLEIWHRDLFDLLEIRKNTGKDELRARDIFTALWIPDNFMRALENDEDYYLFCPNDIKRVGLKPFYEIYGEEFEAEYNKAISLGIGKKVSAKEIALKITESQIETGTPYILFKDNVNSRSNHENIGKISQSNLCAEILQYTDVDTTALCFLSSIVLKNFIRNKKFDFDLLRKEVHRIVKSLNIVIDKNHYSTEKGRKGASEQRAIAIGIQGLADLYFMLDLVFTSEESKKINAEISETIYFSAIEKSMELCKEGKYTPYKYFEGSPMSKGIFQFDMNYSNVKFSGKLDWDNLKEDVKKYGVCNSLFTALMPTATSSQATGSYEMFEPAHSAIFSRKVLDANITIVNKYLIEDFTQLGIWNEQMKNEFILSKGSIQNINFGKFINSSTENYEKKISRIEYLKEKYKTIWEIPQKELINMAADRAPFIDQTQSMNLYMSKPDPSKILSALLYSWKKGLKTGVYYLRSQAISTGATHLAISNSKTEEEILKEKIDEEMKKSSQSSNSSGISCEGCSA